MILIGYESAPRKSRTAPALASLGGFSNIAARQNCGARNGDLKSSCGLKQQHFPVCREIISIHFQGLFKIKVNQNRWSDAHDSLPTTYFSSMNRSLLSSFYRWHFLLIIPDAMLTAHYLLHANHNGLLMSEACHTSSVLTLLFSTHPKRHPRPISPKRGPPP